MTQMQLPRIPYIEAQMLITMKLLCLALIASFILMEGAMAFAPSKQSFAVSRSSRIMMVAQEPFIDEWITAESPKLRDLVVSLLLGKQSIFLTSHNKKNTMQN